MSNPLKAFFRQPVLYIQLPSLGQFWPAEALELPESKELPVYSMTVADDILLKTPDALMNGEAVKNLIESCMPSIKDASQMPICDLNSILMAIRIASTGQMLDIETKCESCNEINPYELNVSSQLENLPIQDWQTPFYLNELMFKFRPITFARYMALENSIFQNQRHAQQIDLIEESETKTKLIANLIQESNKLNLRYVIHSIESVSINTTTITDVDYIGEFLLNCDKHVFEQIKSAVMDRKKLMMPPKIPFVCPNCGNSTELEFNLDYASFFDQSS